MVLFGKGRRGKGHNGGVFRGHKVRKKALSRGGVNLQREKFSICTPPLQVVSSARKGENAFLVLGSAFLGSFCTFLGLFLA